MELLWYLRAKITTCFPLQRPSSAYYNFPQRSSNIRLYCEVLWRSHHCYASQSIYLLGIIIVNYCLNMSFMDMYQGLDCERDNTLSIRWYSFALGFEVCGLVCSTSSGFSSGLLFSVGFLVSGFQRLSVCACVGDLAHLQDLQGKKNILINVNEFRRVYYCFKAVDDQYLQWKWLSYFALGFFFVVCVRAFLFLLCTLYNPFDVGLLS